MLMMGILGALLSDHDTAFFSGNFGTRNVGDNCSFGSVDHVATPMYAHIKMYVGCKWFCIG